jgi:hypothetical protein
MKIQIQYGGHQVISWRILKRKNPILIIKTFVKSLNNLNSLNLTKNWKIMSNASKIKRNHILVHGKKCHHIDNISK